MSNKKYIDFSAGTYDISKVFLQADPTTGALEKVFLPTPGAYTASVQILNASGTGSPTTTDIYNGFAHAVSWSRTGTGLYYASTGYSYWTAGKTVITMLSPGEFGFWYLQTYIGSDLAGFVKYTGAGVQTDDLNNAIVEIRVYS